MMEESENIDQLFREKLWNIEETPPQKVWNRIELQLGHKKKNRGMALFFKIAAGFLLFISLGVGYIMLQHKNKPTVITESQTSGKVKETVIENTGKATEKITEKKPTEPDKQEITVKTINSKMAAIPEKKTPNNKRSVLNNEHQIVNVSEKQVKLPITENDRLFAKSITGERLKPQDARIADIPVIQLPGKIIISTTTRQISSEKITLKDDLTDIDAIPVSQKNPYKEWIIGGQVAPLYAYREISSKDLSAGATSNINNAEKGIISYAGGLNVKYAANRRLSVQSGIYYTKMGQTIHASQIVNNTVNKFLSSSFINKPTYSYSPLNQSNLDQYNNITTISVGSNNISNSIISAKHYYEYLEVPFILRYKIIDKTIDFDILGGVSTNFLLGNDLHFDPGINSSNYLIPVENKLTRINYSGSIGFGIEYPISSKFILNLEPIFKYYLNSINENSNISKYPYTFGFYTGMSYVF